MNVYLHEIKAFIFDNDGTLINTDGVYFPVMEEIAGTKFSEDFKKSLAGLSDMDVAKLMVEKFNLPMTWQEYVQRRQPALEAGLADSPYIEGAKEFLTKIHNLGLPMGLATSSEKKIVDIKISKKKETYDLFDVIVCGDDVPKAKPDPAVYLAAAAKLGKFSPEEVLVFEDAANGALAAQRAGMPCVLLNQKYQTIKELETAFAQIGAKVPLHVVNDWKEFDFKWFNYGKSQNQ